MFATTIRSLTLGTLALALLLASATATAGAFDPKNVVLKDPSGDDKGPGKFVYPTDSAYAKGSFDLKQLTITDKGATLEIKVAVGASVKDPWNSKSWGGNGFSLQMIQVYFDTKKGGRRPALPGMNVKFKKGQAWDKVVFISPQPKSKILAELKSKAKKASKRVVVPQKTYVQGREIIAIVKKSDLGGGFGKGWGVQALMQSNEGYPAAKSVLARAVNEYEGKHRFGGGSDYDCDAHVIDMLAGKAKGGDDEKEAQYKELGSFTCDASGNGKTAEISMVYPGK